MTISSDVYKSRQKLELRVLVAAVNSLCSFTSPLLAQSSSSSEASNPVSLQPTTPHVPEQPLESFARLANVISTAMIGKSRPVRFEDLWYYAFFFLLAGGGRNCFKLVGREFEVCFIRRNPSYRGLSEGCGFIILPICIRSEIMDKRVRICMTSQVNALSRRDLQKQPQDRPREYGRIVRQQALGWDTPREGTCE